MTIQLSSTPSSIQVQSTAQLQNWFMPVAPLVFSYYQGGNVPEAFNQNVTFRDLLGTTTATGYNEFQYKTYIDPASQSNFLSFSGVLATNGIFQNYSNGLNGTHHFQFQNLNILQQGTYTFKVMHQIWAKNSAGTQVKLDEKYFSIVLKVYSSVVPQITPINGITYRWIIGRTTPLSPDSAITINGTSWSVDSPYGFFFASNPNITVTNPTTWGGGNVTGGGSAVVQLAMMPGAVPNPITQNPLRLNLKVNGGVTYIPVTVIFLQESGLFLERNYLEFEAVKGISEAESQQILCDYEGDYSFEYPAWLQASPADAYGTSSTTFSVISSDNLEAGTYLGTVSIKNIYGDVIGTISVKYVVSDVVISPYEGTFCYTLDNLFTKVHSYFPGAYFKMVLRARIYKFGSGDFIDKDPLTFSLPLYQGTQKINIGAAVDRLMENYPDLSQHYENPYSPADVWLDVTEYKGAETETYNLGPLKFIAGLQPQLISGTGILDINPLPRRVTPAGWQVVNIIVNTFALVRILKNGDEISSRPVTTGIHSEVVNFAQLGAAPGDVFSYVLSIPELEENISRRFIVFPEGYTSLLVVWQDEYKLRQVMEFTGKYKMKNTFEHTTQDLARDGVPFLDKVRTDKTGKFTLNTGWVLKSDKITIESLCRAKDALLMHPDGNIRIKPIPQELTMIDIDEATVAFDIDFQINRNYDQEIHMF